MIKNIQLLNFQFCIFFIGSANKICGVQDRYNNENGETKPRVLSYICEFRVLLNILCFVYR